MQDTNGVFDGNGNFNGSTMGGRIGAFNYYVHSRELLSVTQTHGNDVVMSELFLPVVVAKANKHRMELRAAAMAVYGD